MSELLSQCLPNCSVKPPARRGRRHREGKRGGGEGPYGTSCSVQHTRRPQLLAGQPQGALGPAGGGCCQTAFQKASHAAAPAAGGPSPRLLHRCLCNTLHRSPEGHRPTDARLRPDPPRRCRHSHPHRQRAGRCKPACATSAQAPHCI